MKWRQWQRQMTNNEIMVMIMTILIMNNNEIMNNNNMKVNEIWKWQWMIEEMSK